MNHDATSVDQKSATASWIARWRRFRALSPSGSKVLITVGTNYTLAVLGVVTGSLSARLLGPQGRGELAAVQNLFWFVAIAAMLGLPEATLFFIAREPRKSGTILTTGVLLACLSTPIIFLVLYPVVPLLLAAQPPAVISAARWILLGIPLYVLLTVPTFATRGAGSSVRWNLLRLLPGVGWLFLLIGVALADNRDPIFYAWAYLGVLAGVILPAGLLLAKVIRGPYAPSRQVIRPMLRYGLPQAGASVPQNLKLRLDQLVIGALLPPYLLGLYVVAVAWSNAASPVLNAVGNVLFPKIAATDPSSEQRSKMLSQVIRSAVWACLGLTGILLLLTPVMIPLIFGSEFAAAVPVGFILVPAAVICGMSVVLEESLRGLGNTTGVLWAELAGLGTTASILLLLLRPLGILGAGIAAGLGHAVTCGILVPQICRVTGLAPSDLMIPRWADLGGFSGRLQHWWRVVRSQKD